MKEVTTACDRSRGAYVMTSGTSISGRMGRIILRFVATFKDTVSLQYVDELATFVMIQTLDKWSEIIICSARAATLLQVLNDDANSMK